MLDKADSFAAVIVRRKSLIIDAGLPISDRRLLDKEDCRNRLCLHDEQAFLLDPGRLPNRRMRVIASGRGVNRNGAVGRRRRTFGAGRGSQISRVGSGLLVARAYGSYGSMDRVPEARYGIRWRRDRPKASGMRARETQESMHRV